jgi:hypothetical protein
VVVAAVVVEACEPRSNRCHPIGSLPEGMVFADPALRSSAVALADAVFLVNRQRIGTWKQPAFGLRQVQAHGRGIAAVGEKLSDVFHMGPRLVLRRELLQRDEGCRQRFDDHPFVVARNSLSWHRFTHVPKRILEHDPEKWIPVFR